MKKKLAQIFLILVLVAIGVLGYSISKQLDLEEVIEQRITSLPEFELQTMEGEIWNSNVVADSLALIVNFFNTECPFCNAEIRSIVNHHQLGNVTNVILISDQSLEVLRRFRNNYQLENVTGIRIMRDSTGSVKELFGVKGVPTTFVYSIEKDLISSIKGEIKAEVLYKLVRKTPTRTDSTGILPGVDCEYQP
ncbi:MAG: redoxin domain-containing protein [Balneolaceae bacterium]|nr:redoxin domain-containing protein [Balneolaceae bacterium]